MNAANSASVWRTLIPVAIFVVVFGLRLRRMDRVRPLKIEWLWVVPLIYTVIVVATFVALPPSLGGWGLALLGLAAGSALGWQRGRMMRIEVDAATQSLRQRSSPAAMLLIFAIVLLRMAGRSLFGSPGALAAGASALLATDALLGFALGLLTMTRVEMYLRGKRLLGEARVGTGDGTAAE